MSILVLKQLSGPRIGFVTQNPDGSLDIRCEDLAYEPELTKLLSDIAKGPLALRTGYERQLPDGGTSYVTVVNTYYPGEPDYLLALADAVARNKTVIGGRRVRAYVQESS